MKKFHEIGSTSFNIAEWSLDLLQGNLNNQKDSRSLKPVKTWSNNIEPVRLFNGFDMLGHGN